VPGGPGCRGGKQRYREGFVDNVVGYWRYSTSPSIRGSEKTSLTGKRFGAYAVSKTLLREVQTVVRFGRVFSGSQRLL